MLDPASQAVPRQLDYLLFLVDRLHHFEAHDCQAHPEPVGGDIVPIGPYFQNHLRELLLFAYHTVLVHAADELGLAALQQPVVGD